MKGRKILVSILAAAVALAALALWTAHRTQWSRELLAYLDGAETVTGEALWQRPDHQESRTLSAGQADAVIDMIRHAKLTDNRGFAGTTPDFEVVLVVDGELVFVDPWEVQYKYQGENRSVSMRLSEEGKGALRELLKQSFPEAGEAEF